MRKHLRLNFSDTNLVKTQRETTQFDVKMTVISYWSKRKLICSFVRNLHTKQHISSINCFFIFYSGFSQVSVETSQQGMFTFLLSNVQNGCAYTLWHVFGHSFLKIASYYIIFVSPFLLWAQILWFIYLLYKKRLYIVLLLFLSFNYKNDNLYDRQTSI